MFVEGSLGAYCMRIEKAWESVGLDCSVGWSFVVQVNLKLRRVLPLELLPVVVDGFDEVGDGEKGVGARGTAQVSNGDGLRIVEAGVEACYGSISCVVVEFGGCLAGDVLLLSRREGEGDGVKTEAAVNEETCCCCTMLRRERGPPTSARSSPSPAASLPSRRHLLHVQRAMNVNVKVCG
nr:hypothetical protein Iba_chr14aCG16780 [Ipomoea batatas]